MKKIAVFLLVASVIFTVCGCRGRDENNVSSEVLQSGVLIAPDDTKTPSQNSSSKAEEKNKASVPSETQNETLSPGKITYIFLDNVPLEEFTPSKKEYTVLLGDEVTTPPTVSALKTDGRGEIKITQAKSATGSATVSLNGDAYTIKFTKKDYSQVLANSYYKLTVKKKLNVAYFGGSVTQGFGASNPESDSWRAITTKWLKSKFSNSSINETNAAIGGTGSSFGVYRAVDDLKLKTAEKPDLVFLEFAINDIYDGIATSTAKSNIEYIIRTIYSFSPDCDIMLVFITDQGRMNNEYDIMKAHISVAEAYKLPYIKVGAMLWDDMTAENGGKYPSSQWKSYFTDSVHPTSKGYKKYAGYITDYLDKAFAAKKGELTLKNSYKPANAINPQPVSPYMANFKGQTVPDGFTVDSNGYLKGSTAGKSFTFTFTGTDLKLWIWGLANGGDLTVEIDGQNKGSAELYRSYSNHKIVSLASGLENKRHTVKLTLNNSSHGCEMDIRYVLIMGSEQSGVTMAN